MTIHGIVRTMFLKFLHFESQRIACKRRRDSDGDKRQWKIRLPSQATQRTVHGQLHDNGKVLTDILQCNAASVLQSQHLVLSLCGLFSNVNGVKEIYKIYSIIIDGLIYQMKSIKNKQLLSLIFSASISTL